MVDLASLSESVGAFEKVLSAIIIMVVGILLSRVAGSVTAKLVGKKINPHVAKISKKVVSYTIIGISFITALDLFIEVSTLLAAAGIAGIAIGMAAKTSVSNIISGIFLLADRPFEIGDAVDIGGDAGEVIDISLFSARLRTFDNKYLRIPNETVATAKIINLTHYDLRRLEILVGIAYSEDVGKALEVISSVVKKEKLVLADPEPLVMATGFGDSSIDLSVRAWVQRTELLSARTELMIGIKKALEDSDIEIPFPTRTLHFGEGEVERFKGG
jgi:small-conductance mechanosensitive channel